MKPTIPHLGVNSEEGPHDYSDDTIVVKKEPETLVSPQSSSDVTIRQLCEQNIEQL